MPFEFSDQQSPTGMTYLRIEATGHCDVEDGKELEAQLLRPEQSSGKVLSVVSKGVVYSHAFRKFVPSINDKYTAMAVAVTSPIVKTAINLMLRLTPSTGGLVRMFMREADALEWLEQQP